MVIDESKPHFYEGQVILIEYYGFPVTEVIVEKVGYKWITVTGDLKIDKNTLFLKQNIYGRRGKCYLSKEAYKEEKERMQLWSNFRSKINSHYVCPDNINIEKIKETAKSLGFLID